MVEILNKVDHEFLDALFPQYLLRQPMGHSLRKLYFDNRYLFARDIDEQVDVERLFGSDEDAGIDDNASGGLKMDVRKKIWKKLISLGVLGSLSFEVASDEYLIQLYKYFYPESFNGTLGKQGAGEAKNCGKKAATDGHKHSFKKAKYGKEKSATRFDYAQSNQRSLTRNNGGVETSEGIESESIEDNLEEDEEGEEELENDDDDVSDGLRSMDGRGAINESNVESELTQDDMEIDDEVIMDSSEGLNENFLDSPIRVIDEGLRGEDLSRRATESSANETQKNSNLDESSSHSHTPNNNEQVEQVTKPNIYQLIGYFFPSRWMTQSNSDISISHDGISRLGNEKLNSGTEINPQLSRGSLGSTLDTGKKEYAYTWANNFLTSEKVGIFYYEISILTTSNVQGPHNAHINVGYKRWTGKTDVNSSELSSVRDGTRSGFHSQSRTTTSAEGRTFRSFHSRIHTDTSDSSTESIINTIYAYKGADGKITAVGSDTEYGAPFGIDDVIGCGINYINGTIFFTINGVYLGTAYKDLHDFNMIPYISLEPGNSVSTNFGLREEFAFNIMGYLDFWRSHSYLHIFRNEEKVDLELNAYQNNRNDDSKYDGKYLNDASTNLDKFLQTGSIDESDSEKTNSFKDIDAMELYKLSDNRYKNGKLIRPNNLLLNHLKTDDDSLQSTLKTIVNDYLINEGLADVAKAFVKDIKADRILETCNNDRVDLNQYVLLNNERKIKLEEDNLMVRQKLRRLIKNHEYSQCITEIDRKYPDLLKLDNEMLFKLRVAEFLGKLIEPNGVPMNDVITMAQELTKSFVFDINVPANERVLFKQQLDEITSLLAYEDPKNDGPPELKKYLESDFLVDQVIQTVNRSILSYLNRSTNNSLDTIIKYSRAMVSTLSELNSEGDLECKQNDETEMRYYKLVDVDEDILKV